MARIYISSTYSDLAEARETVCRALRKMQHDVVAMEDYVATDQRPVDKCLADVAGCDIYVGIFAWRYGYIPPNQQRSITEMEFRKAHESDIPCLLFVLHEEAPWPRKLMDRDVEQIEKLRTELGRDYVVSFFRTPDQLAVDVAAAVGNLEKKLPAAGARENTQLVDLIGKLVSEFAQLEQRKAVDHKLYDDFVAPALADFEKVHQNYLETFQNYRRMINESGESLTVNHPVLKRLEEDSLFSSQLRSKLQVLNELQKDPLFGAFIASIVQYTRGSEQIRTVVLTGRRRIPNAPRDSAIVGLKEIFESENAETQKQEAALALIDGVVEELQFMYGRALGEHMKLKQALLKDAGK